MAENLTRKQVAALTRSLKRKGWKLPSVGSCLRVVKGTEICRDRTGYYMIGGLTKAQRNEIRREIPNRARDKWIVHEGRPSWHQQRAGHISAASSVFYSESEARAYAARLRARGETAAVSQQPGKARR